MKCFVTNGFKLESINLPIEYCVMNYLHIKPMN